MRADGSWFIQGILNHAGNTSPKMLPIVDRSTNPQP